MGLGLGNFLLDAAQMDEGARARARQDTADQDAQLQLQQQQRQNDEQQRQFDLAAKTRGVVQQSWQDASDAADQYNQQLTQDAQPTPVQVPDPNAPMPQGTDDISSVGAPPAPTVTKYKNKYGVFDTPEQALSVAQGKKTDAQTVWEREFAPKVIDNYMKNGEPDKAANLQDWIRSQHGKQYLNEYDQGMKQMVMGNKQGAMDTFTHLYNAMVPDGHYGRWEDAGNGQTRIVSYDSKTGETTSHIIDDQNLGPTMAMMLDPTHVATQIGNVQQALAVQGAKNTHDIYMELMKHQLGQDTEMMKQSMQFQRDVQLAFLNHNLDQIGGKFDSMQQPRNPGDPILVKKGGVDYALTPKQDGSGTYTVQNITPAQAQLYQQRGYTPSVSWDTVTAGMGGPNNSGYPQGQQPQQNGTGAFPVPKPSLIDRARQHPEERGMFEATFGPGSYQKYVGATGAPMQHQPVAQPAPAAKPAAKPAATPKKSGVNIQSPEISGLAPQVTLSSTKTARDQADSELQAAMQTLSKYGVNQRTKDPAGYAKAELAVKQAQQKYDAAHHSWLQQMWASTSNPLAEDSTSRGNGGGVYVPPFRNRASR